ncbi:GNAT family N-acetyltransferase [Xanthomonas maliensis]|uniref:GNAT family N-acetyltransferase n=1 Tax=Xanthomonas maliensis TaxID=1321368 RepID=UPI0004CFBA33|nr:GNAT family N-acetyltransferase [Xanthomonas maliensis]KAB7768886.1 N-acetyltransferase [Xanthomonas maliensis]
MASRPQREADLPALRALFRTQRWAEFAMLPWDDAARAAFIDQQFDAQQRHYTLSQAHVLFLVITEGERVIGRLYLGGDATRTVRLLDILLLPDRRGQGVGTMLIAALLAQAKVDGREVVLQVDKHNPAFELYRRLGFRTYEDTGIAWKMAWSQSTSERR